MTHTRNIPANCLIMTVWAVLIMGITGLPCTEAATCVFDELADIPLDAKVGAAPGTIMILFDDSGSMEWSMNLDNVSYVCDAGGFDADGDGYRDKKDVYRLGDYRMWWKTQCVDFNTLYYNPDARYRPWPGQTDADPQTPKNPFFDDSIALSGTFADLSVPDTADIEHAPGVIIIDNRSVDPYEMIVDDGSRTFLTYHCQDGDGIPDDPVTWDRISSTYSHDGDYCTLDTGQGTPPFKAVHSFNLPADGAYDVYIRYYRHPSRGTATYTVHADGVDQSFSVNQYRYYGEDSGWIRLGNTVNFKAGEDNARVSLVYDGKTGKSISSDAVKLISRSTGQDYTVFSHQGPDGYAWKSYDNPDAYLGNFFCTSRKGNYTATWKTDILDKNKTYNVYVRWVSGAQRSDSVHYSVNTTPETSRTVDQTVHNGQWMLLAANAAFPGGTGQVTLAHYIPYDNSEQACADSVAFVPTDQVATADIQIANSHYYIEGIDHTHYLVNITTSTIDYYRIDHTKGSDSDYTVFPGEDTDKIVPDELLKITDEQATAAGIRYEGTTHGKTLQNFANWYAYYRQRQYTAKNAIGKIIDTMAGVRIGILGINNKIEQAAVPIDLSLNGTDYDKTGALLTQFYQTVPNGGTPLRSGLYRIGQYFKGDDPALNSMTDSLAAYISGKTAPFFEQEHGGSCQQAFCILMTDGYYTGQPTVTANEDKAGSHDTTFDGGKFADDQSGTLADAAMLFYETDLNPDLDNEVPTTDKDTADHQHLVTFSIAFGVKGLIDPAAYPDCPVGDCPADWWGGDPESEDARKMKVDDLYHAAVNGRGDYYNAGTPEELVSAIDDIINQINNRLGSAAAAATNSIQVYSGTKIYQGRYYTDKWYGDLVQYTIDPATGDIDPDVDWSAKERLDGNDNVIPNIPGKPHDDRVIFTYDGTEGIPFRFGQPGIPADWSEDWINYIRGDRTNEQTNGGPYRNRASRLGDIVHSAPAFFSNDRNDPSKGRLYVGANDGMLHMFDKQTGEELFAYIPKIIVDSHNLEALPDPSYNDNHRFFVDNTVTLKHVPAGTNGQTLLAGGLGRGGKGIFCLDVSDARFSTPGKPAESDAEQIVKWEYSAESGFTQAADNDMGHVYGNLFIVNTNAPDVGHVVIFANGYGSVNESAVLYLVDISDDYPTAGNISTAVFTGSGIKKIDTGIRGCNGLGSPAVIDVNMDGKADYVYAGDLKGNLWKFDLSAAHAAQWGIAHSDGENANKHPMPLITVKNNAGGQPITVEPNVMKMACHPDHAQPGYLVFFGTGRYIGTNDPAMAGQQTFYGIWDFQDAFPKEQQTACYLGSFNCQAAAPVLSGSGSALSTADSLGLVRQGIYTTVSGFRVMSDNPVSWYEPPAGDEDTPAVPDHAGWFFNLVDTGARVIQDPLIRPGTGNDVGVVAFISSVPSISDCGGSAGHSWFYQLSACSGGVTDDAHFDTDDDGQVNKDDQFDDPNPNSDDKLSPSGKHFDQMLYKPIMVGPYLYINDSSGDPPNKEEIQDTLTGKYNWQIIH